MDEYEKLEEDLKKIYEVRTVIFLNVWTVVSGLECCVLL